MILLNIALTNSQHNSRIRILANYDGTHMNVWIKSVSEHVDEVNQSVDNKIQLGISVCEKIIEQNKGQLEISSKNNQITIKFSMQMFNVEQAQAPPNLSLPYFGYDKNQEEAINEAL